MPSVIECPGGWCCGRLYIVSDVRAWHCPSSGVPLRSVHRFLSESDWLTWNDPWSMEHLLSGQRKRDLLAGAVRQVGLESLFGSAALNASSEQNKHLCDIIRDLLGNPFRTVVSRFRPY
jgi:hypothetical protein